MSLLPNEWIENSIEVYNYQHTTKSQAIYWVVLAAVTAALISLPFIYIDISVQGSGVIRPITEKTEIKAAVTELVDSVYVREGQQVNKGDILLRFRTSNPDYKITYQTNCLNDYEAHLADLTYLSRGEVPANFRSPVRQQEYTYFTKRKNELETSLTKAKKEYERMKELLPNKIVSEKDFAQARQTYENARISYEAVAQNHSAQGQAIPSPISGYVKSLLVKEGDYVTVGQPLVSVTQNRKLFLRADVSEKYYPYLRTIGSANFCTPYDNKVYTLKELNGRLLSYGKASGENSYYVPVTFEFDNKGDIIPGSFVEIFLLSSPMENVIALPHTALTEEQGSFFVYLQIDEKGYKKQPVTLGADNGEKVQILSGVKAGDKVVTQGAYQVKLAGATNAIPAHSHEH